MERFTLINDSVFKCVCPACQVTWLVNSNQAQTATLSFRYANGGATSHDGIITVNGTDVGALVLAPTGSWETWNLVTVNVDLAQGSNELTLTATTADGLSDAQCLVTEVKTAISTDLSICPNPTSNSVHLSTESVWVLWSQDGIELSNGQGIFVNLQQYELGVYCLEIEDIRYKIIKK